MRKSIDTYVQGIAHDNAEFIVNGSESIADYIIKTAENGTGYEEFFDDDELDETGEPTDEQIDELKDYLNQNYNYLPERNLEDIAAENGLELIDTTSTKNGYPQDLQKAIIGFDSLRWFLDKMEKIKDEIEDAEVDELVLACCGEYYSTIKKRTMSYAYDTHHYAIGLIDRNKD